MQYASVSKTPTRVRGFTPSERAEKSNAERAMSASWSSRPELVNCAWICFRTGTDTAYPLASGMTRSPVPKSWIPYPACGESTRIVDLLGLDVGKDLPWRLWVEPGLRPILATLGSPEKLVVTNPR